MRIRGRGAIKKHRTRSTGRPRGRVHAQRAVRASGGGAPSRVMSSERSPPQKQPVRLTSDKNSLVMRPSWGQRGTLAYLAELEAALAVHSAGVYPLPRRVRRVGAPDPQHRVGVVFVGGTPPLPLEEEEVDYLFCVVAGRAIEI